MTNVIPPKPTAFEVEACQFSSWYTLFRNMKSSNTDTAMDDDDDDDASTGSSVNEQQVKFLKEQREEGGGIM